MNGIETEVAIIVLAPLAGALILGVFGDRLGERLVSIIACSTVGLSAVLAFHVVLGNLFQRAEVDRQITSYLFTWIDVGNLRADFSFFVDPLSGIYILFITFVAFWIHIFATGYMHGDPGYARFFTYMNLFMFSMLTLILANNYLLMFVGWEGVGLCSYLLIGFWYKDNNNAIAGKKAFIFNRVGDFGFAVGLMLLFFKSGSIFYFSDPQHGINLGAFNWAMGLPKDNIGLSAIFAGGITTIAVLLFVGATGKSAQIPLYVWLPDAMAGPTPVSALIHAATMVTAGVYMVSRSSAIYVHAPSAMFIVAIIGAVTAFFAATIGLAQWDIKKVLAYSTISQLGYMFLACGVGAFGAGVFHVVTHAFFKALLFLCAGSVILALHHEQDMRKMGGLRKYLPVTFFTMGAAWLAICGVPLLSGFFSKDAILSSAFEASGLFPAPWPKVLWFIGIVTALLTAIYMTRLMVMTFWGDERFRHASHGNDHAAGHGTGHDDGHGQDATPREPSFAVLLPLVVLAVGAVLAGYWNFPTELGGNERFSRMIERSIATEDAALVGSRFIPHLAAEVSAEAAAIEASPNSHEKIVVHEQKQEGGGLGLMTLSAMVAIGGILIAWFWFGRSPLWQPPRILEEKYKIDELYEATVIHPAYRLSTDLLWKIIDVEIIDGTVNGIAQATAFLGKGLRYVQSGVARSYVAAVVLGAILLIGYFVIR